MEWNKLKRAKVCISCGKRFIDSEDYCSILFYNAGEFSRQDYCMTCWNGIGSVKKGKYISCWQGRYRQEEVKAEEEPIRRSVVEKLLRKYLGSDEPAHVNVRYILALMMERKKKLLPRDRVTEPETGKSMVVYEFAGSGETLLIEDPGLELNDTRRVQQQVRELLREEGITGK